MNKAPLENIARKLKDSYMEAVHYGYSELADKIVAADDVLIKLEGEYYES